MGIDHTHLLILVLYSHSHLKLDLYVDVCNIAHVQCVNEVWMLHISYVCIFNIKTTYGSFTPIPCHMISIFTR